MARTKSNGGGNKTDRRGNGPPKGSGGAPEKTLDWAQFDTLCKMQCTKEEMAQFFGMDEKTIKRIVEREKQMSYSEYFEQKCLGGYISIRRRQYQRAMNGSVAMLIWLGKQWLGQSDKSEIKQKVTGEIGHEHRHTLKLDFNKLDDKQLKALVQLTSKPDLIIDAESGEVESE